MQNFQPFRDIGEFFGQRRDFACLLNFDDLSFDGLNSFAIRSKSVVLNQEGDGGFADLVELGDHFFFVFFQLLDLSVLGLGRCDNLPTHAAQAVQSGDEGVEFIPVFVAPGPAGLVHLCFDIFGRLFGLLAKLFNFVELLQNEFGGASDLFQVGIDLAHFFMLEPVVRIE